MIWLMDPPPLYWRVIAVAFALAALLAGSGALGMVLVEGDAGWRPVMAALLTVVCLMSLRNALRTARRKSAEGEG